MPEDTYRGRRAQRIETAEEVDPDRLKAVANLVRQAKDALQVDISLDGTFHFVKGDPAGGGDIRDAGR